MCSITLDVLLNTRYYPIGTNGSLRIFLPRSIQKSVTCAPIVTGTETSIKFWLPREISADVPILMWWSPQRGMVGTEHIETKSKPYSSTPQPYQALAGHCRVSLGRLQLIKPLIQLKDYGGAEIGSVEVHIAKVDAPGVTIFDSDSATKWDPREIESVTTSMTTLMEEKLRKAHELNAGTNITSCLQRTSFHEITLPVGSVPVWSFPYAVWQMARESVRTTDTEKLFLGLLAITKHSLRRRVDTASDELKAEMLSDMMTVASRYSLYVKDGSLRNGVEKGDDEWNYMLSEGYDCEDGTAWALQLDTMFRAATFSDPELQELQALNARYQTMFCIGSLSLGKDAYTYHAFLLKLDANYPTGKLLLAPVLLESTAWSIGCWQYKDPNVTSESYSRGHRMRPVECLAKVHPDLLRGLYLHVQVAFCPALLESDGVARIDFTQNGRIGASIADVMDGVTRGIKLITTKIRPDELSRVIQAYDCMPPLSTFDAPPSMVTLRRPAREHKEAPAVDVCYRDRDWTLDLATSIGTVFKGTASDFEVTRILVSKAIKGVRVRGW